MIRIGKYGIDTTERSFAIGKIQKSVNKKTGLEEERLADPGYYSTLDGALMAVYRRLIAEGVNTYDGDLKGVVEAVRKRTRDFERMVQEALPKPKLGKEG